MYKCKKITAIIKPQKRKTFFHQIKRLSKKNIFLYISVSTHSEGRHIVTESSLRVPLTISSLFTNWVPILWTMAVTQYVCSKISMMNMQKILSEILNDMVRNYHDPQHEPDTKKN